MSRYPRSSDTTCTARTVDAAIRGAAIGAMWGGVQSYSSHRSDRSSKRRRVFSRIVFRSAVDVASFLSIYSAVHCMATRSSHSDSIAAGMAGAAAGCFAGARSGASGRMLVGTCIFCSAVSVGVSAFEMRGE